MSAPSAAWLAKSSLIRCLPRFRRAGWLRAGGGRAGNQFQPVRNLQCSQKWFKFLFGGMVGPEITDFCPLPGPPRPLGGLGKVSVGPALELHRSSNRQTNSILCYAIVLPGRRSDLQAGFWLDCYRERTEIGLQARPKSGPEGRFTARKYYCVT